MRYAMRLSIGLSLCLYALHFQAHGPIMSGCLLRFGWFAGQVMAQRVNDC